MQKDRHCSYCGVAFPEALAWPRTCGGCGGVTYRNPTPVAVILLPVDDGLLGIRRGIEPRLGQLALPGGYVDATETWQEAAARELFEETNIVIDPTRVTDHGVRSVGNGGPILIFGVAPHIASRLLPPFTPTNETTERVILKQTDELAFPLHEWAVQEWFRSAAVKKPSIFPGAL